MNRMLLALLLIFALTPLAEARGPSSSTRSTTRRSAPRAVSTPRSAVHSAPRTSARSTWSKCTTCARDSSGRIARSSSARRDFQKSNPCPATRKTTGACKGYVIDHVIPLKRGGMDSEQHAMADGPDGEGEGQN
jgi:hypothetical protein